MVTDCGVAWTDVFGRIWGLGLSCRRRHHRHVGCWEGQPQPPLGAGNVRSEAGFLSIFGPSMPMILVREIHNSMTTCQHNNFSLSMTRIVHHRHNEFTTIKQWPPSS